MKAILMSIRPQHVANILNKIKTLEIRKRFPSDYVGWVYIYCTKDSKSDETLCYDSFSGILGFRPNYRVGIADNVLNGKVVARFWCDKVEDFEFCEFSKHKDNLELYNECVRKDNELCKKACISCVKMVQYLDTKAIGKDMFGKAIHITKVEPFDKPKEISEFRKPSTFSLEQLREIGLPYTEEMYKDMATKGKWFLTRAPQSWCYIEV